MGARSAAGSKQSPLHEQVSAALEQIRPVIQSDGGDVRLVGVTDGGVVRIQLLGACVGCPSATMTLKSGIERNLVGMIPGVTAVEAVE